MGSEQFRIEKDSMGEMKVPANAYYGPQTQRAVENFPISGIRFSRPLIAAMGIIKGASAKANSSLGLLDSKKMSAIVAATEEVRVGKLDEQFVVDIFQTGSGTSTNMNANEVIAKRAQEIAGGDMKLHPNDHVNMSQSSNDVIPTAIHIAVATQISSKLLPALNNLKNSLAAKSKDFAHIVKTGRTHLQDATPITLGQEFSGYQRQVELGIERIERSLVAILELPLGGTAVGTGLNTHPDFAKKAIAEIVSVTSLAFFEAKNHFEAQAAKDALVEMSGQLRVVAVSLTKVANDIRWLAAGPRCSLGEISIPEVQPGSSIMPAKVNPVIVESLLMACAQVIGNDAAVAFGGATGSQFELNVMMPVMAHNILQSIELLSNSARNFSSRCIDGIKANEARIKELAEANIATVTALAPKIGYDLAAKVAKEAYQTGETLRQVALRHNVLPQEELDKALDLMAMTKPGL